MDTFDWDAFNASKDPREHTHELPTRDGTSTVYCIETHLIGVAGQGDVWCSLCDQPATKEILLSTGETVGRCSIHAWLLATSIPQNHSAADHEAAIALGAVTA